MHVIGFLAKKAAVEKRRRRTAWRFMPLQKSTVGFLDMDPQQSLAEWYERRRQQTPPLYTDVTRRAKPLSCCGAEASIIFSSTLAPAYSTQ